MCRIGAENVRDGSSANSAEGTPTRAVRVGDAASRSAALDLLTYRVVFARQGGRGEEAAAEPARSRQVSACGSENRSGRADLQRRLGKNRDRPRPYDGRDHVEVDEVECEDSHIRGDDTAEDCTTDDLRHVGVDGD